MRLVASKDAENAKSLVEGNTLFEQYTISSATRANEASLAFGGVPFEVLFLCYLLHTTLPPLLANTILYKPTLMMELFINALLLLINRHLPLLTLAAPSGPVHVSL